jgi:hypothetical protein
MKALRIALLCLAIAGMASARPVVLEEVATLTRPDASWTYFGRAGVAIDGDYALVSGERFIPDPNAEGGVRHEVAAFLYRRSGSNWVYDGQLGPLVGAWDILSNLGLAMKDGIAVTALPGVRIFERVGTTWTQAALDPAVSGTLQGPDIEISGGRILAARDTFYYESVVLRKLNGTWSAEGTLTGNASDCIQDFCPASGQDLDGTRAIMHNPQDDFISDPHRLYVYRLNAAGTGWEYEAHAELGSADSPYGPNVALNGELWAINASRQSGTQVAYRLSEGMYAWAHYGLQPVDGYLQRTERSTAGIERFRNLFAQQNYSFDRKAFVINLFRINNDDPHSNTHVATLQGKSGTHVGRLLDTSGNRIIASGWGVIDNRYVGGNTVRIFEVPTTLEAPPVQSHDFEMPSDAALWQPTAGSSFSIVKSGTTSVYRQASTAGDAASFLPTSTATHQAIQAEVTIRSVNGADRWVGLATRRGDDSHYYYVTLRTSGVIEFKSNVGGTITTLASRATTVTVGKKYRLRLESMGSSHRVYLNDNWMLTARDDALTEGTAGVIMYRASADFDNVTVSPTPFTTIYADNFTNPNFANWSGTWPASGGVLHQTSNAGYARLFTGAISDDQVVRARIRPLTFAQPDNWVGLMARYLDDRNHLYVSLRGRGVISLWRRTNNVITNLGVAALTVTPGTWYDVRVEVVSGLTRVFVNDQLLISTNADPGPVNPGVEWQMGRVGLVTYRATADFDNFLAYQP